MTPIGAWRAVGVFQYWFPTQTADVSFVALKREWGSANE